MAPDGTSYGSEIGLEATAFSLLLTIASPSCALFQSLTTEQSVRCDFPTTRRMPAYNTHQCASRARERRASFPRLSIYCGAIEAERARQVVGVETAKRERGSAPVTARRIYIVRRARADAAE